MDAIDFTQSPELTTVAAGAILTAVGCEPAPPRLIDHLGYGHEGVVTQTELAELLDDWEEQSWLGRQPGEGDRDDPVRRLARPPPAALLLAALLHDRAQARDPAARPVPRDEGDDLLPRDARRRRRLRELVSGGAARRRGVPARHAAEGAVRRARQAGDRGRGHDRRPARSCCAPTWSCSRPAWCRPTDTERIADVLNVDLDEDGFIEILDRKNRATETTAEGVFVCGSAAGPKALVEFNTEASAVASEIHNFLTSAGRRRRPASSSRRPSASAATPAARCARSARSTLVERPADAPRPAEVKDDGKLAVIDDEACRACGICAANCPEMAIAHNLDDEALFGRLRDDDRGRRAAGRRLLLQGVRRRGDQPERPAPRHLPRERAPHRAALPGPRQRPAHRRGGPAGRSRRVPRRLRRRPLPVPHAATSRRAEQVELADELLAEAGHSRSRSSSGICAPSTGTRSAGASASSARVAEGADGVPDRRADPSFVVAAGSAACQGGEGCVHVRWLSPPTRPSTRWPTTAASAFSAASASAPARAASICEQGPRRIVRLILAGDVEALLAAEDVWRCSECGACTDACPMEVDRRRDDGRRARAAARVRRRALPRARRRRHRRRSAWPAATASTTWPSAWRWPRKGYVPRDVVGAAGAAAKIVKGMIAGTRRRAPRGYAPRRQRARGAAALLRRLLAAAGPRGARADAIEVAARARPAARRGRASAGCCGHPSRGQVAAKYDERRAGAHRLPGLRRTACASRRSTTTPLWQALVEHAERNGRGLRAARAELRAVRRLPERARPGAELAQRGGRARRRRDRDELSRRCTPAAAALSAACTAARPKPCAS